MSRPDFEALYSRVGTNLRSVPWALLEPHPSFVDWLDRGTAPAAGTALIVGCGLGDDAEEAARRGFQVTAFDIAPSALRLARRRFKKSVVTYQVADLLVTPDAWLEAFDLVVEIRNLQCVPRASRPAAIAAIAGCARPGGGVVFVRGMLAQRGTGGRGRQRLPLLPSELTAFTEAGLVEREFTELPNEGAFVAVYTRP
jgi:SAM-dependent methyltransferase